jgi:pimeloyl-ACP methyl ester carboxylesterase
MLIPASCQRILNMLMGAFRMRTEYLAGSRLETDEKNGKIRLLRFEIQPSITIGGILYPKGNIKDFPTLIFFHGGGELASDYRKSLDSLGENVPVSKLYTDCGVNLAVFDYRGNGFSTGTSTYADLFNDPIPLFKLFKEWLNREYGGVSSKSFFIMGRSIGGSSAAVFGPENIPEIKGLILESSYSDNFFSLKTPSMIADSTPELLNCLRIGSNDTYVKQTNKPCLIIHGKSDQVAPFFHAENNFKCIPESVAKTMVAIPSAGHNTVMRFDEYFVALKKFIGESK